MLSDAHWLIRPGLTLCYVPAWLNASVASDTLQTILQRHRFTQGQIQLFGRWVDEPRTMDWCGHLPYTYAHKCLPPKPWTPVVSDLRQQLVMLLADLQITLPRDPLNHLLMNHYRDGQDSMGYNQDNERELGFNPLIVSLSLGATRRFVVRPHPASVVDSAPLRFDLAAGDVLLMAGRTQVDWQHQIAKTRKQSGSRVNLTFRTICEAILG